jgi:predicted pyridoxine 5'-phosphate oxidase superfamily flavin-nucleotide-binding protein
MGRRFAEIAFTPTIKEQQRKRGSRNAYERVEQSADLGDRLGPHEKEFIGERDSFYMASISETGWPYVQHRGGLKGFLHIFDDRTIGFADLRGNKQYISVGNLKSNDRVTLFLMDYPGQRRLKILGHAQVFEGGEEAEKPPAQLQMPEEQSPAERVMIVHVEAFDWNCPQHITPRYTQEELEGILQPMRLRLNALEAENKRLRAASH